MRIASGLAAIVLLGIPCAQAQGWTPQKNVELVVPVAPGGTNDKLARAIERTLVGGKLVGTSVSVVHKAGGGNQIAYAYVGQHAGDPHYLLMGTSTLITAHATGASKISYGDFSPIASIFNDFAVSSAKRLPGPMASVPTWKEQGVDLVYGSWRSIVGPKGLRPEQVTFWENALRKVVDSADWKAELERNYWADFFMTGAELRATIDREYKAMKGVLVDLGLAKP